MKEKLVHNLNQTQSQTASLCGPVTAFCTFYCAQLLSNINTVPFLCLCYACFWKSFHQQLLTLLTNGNKYYQELLKAWKQD